MVITIDGPVAAGKTTAAHGLGELLQLSVLDTGAIYRCVALEARNRGLDWQDESAVSHVADALPIEFRMEAGRNRVLLAGSDVTTSIRQPHISQGASIVSALAGVRSALLSIQRQQASNRHLIAEGRDTGTVVFPSAELKFFLTATAESRAQRRCLELRTKGEIACFEEVFAELQERDARDSTRSIAPLVPAEDAITIDSTHKTAIEVVTEIHDSVSRDRRLNLP